MEKSGNTTLNQGGDNLRETRKRKMELELEMVFLQVRYQI